MSLIKFKYYNFKNSFLFGKNKYSSNLNNKINNFNNEIKTIDSLKIVLNNDQLKEVKKISKNVKNVFEHYCIVGIGGSTLGSQALINILPEKKKNRFFFYENIDPISFEDSLKKHNLKKTIFIIISKSGFTAETLALFGALIEIYERSKLKKYISRNFICITEKKYSPLSYIAKELKIRSIVHNKNIGGRFSVFSNVGLFPAYLAGFNTNLFIRGAREVLFDAINGSYKFHIAGAMSTILLNDLKKMNINVLFTYSDYLLKFGSWYKQLWSESIGKNSFSTTPMHSIGAIDQHSQIQLYLDGPKDKYFTFITTEHNKKGLLINNKILKKSELSYLSGKKIGDLMQAEQKATIQTLINKKIPIREIFIKEINEKTLGSLMMHFVLETIFASRILKINAFDQPAVERGKILTKKYIK